MTMMKNVRLRLSVYVLCLPVGSLESQGIGQFVKVIFSPIDLNRLLFTDGPCWTSDHKGWAILLNFLPPLACCPELACPEEGLTLLLFLYQLHIFSWCKLVPLCLLPSVVLILFGTFCIFFFSQGGRSDDLSALFELCIIGLSFENFELIPREWGIVRINHSKYFQ